MSHIWTVYLSGEIHTDWREQIMNASNTQKLPMRFVSAVTNHGASDAAGDVLGDVPAGFLRDQQSCLLYTSPSPRDLSTSRMPSSA